MKKLFVLMIKFVPIIMMVGMLSTNLCCYFEVGLMWTNLFDFILGNSLLISILLYVCSYTFGLCSWHRLIITANLINITIASYDILFGIPISDLKLLALYYIVATVFILIILYNKFFNKNEKCHKSIG